MEESWWARKGGEDAREDWARGWSRGPRTRESIRGQMRVAYEIVLMDESDYGGCVESLTEAYARVYRELGGEVQ